MILNSFRWYRRWVGGRWARVNGLCWGSSWVRLANDAFGKGDEYHPIKTKERA